MKDQRGLTLIELIISLGLLGIISVGMLSAMATNYKMLAHSKTMTADVFDAQRTLEDRIQAPPDVSTVETITLRLRNNLGNVYEKDVVGYPLNVEIANGRTLYTFDSETQMPEPSVPVAQNVLVAMKNDATVVDHVYAVDTRSNLTGSHSIRTDTVPDWLYTQHRWYVSKNTTVKAFNPIIPGGIIPEADWGVRYPRFPDDYDLIPGATTAQLDDLTNYKGRHIVYAVRPVAKTGRIGTEVHSSPVWVIGLPVVSGLKVHLDASLIPTTPGVPVSAWTDLSATLPSGSNPTSYSNNATQGTGASQPMLSDAYFGKCLTFDGINDSLAIANQSEVDLDNLTVIAVAKSASSYRWFNPIITKHHTSNAWGLGWTADMGTIPMKKMGFFIKSNAGFPPRATTDLRQGNLDEGLNDAWHVFRGTADSAEVGLWMDALQKERAARTVGTNISSSNAISIGGYSGGYSDMDLAEVIVYDGSLTDAQLTEIDNYLVEKYAAVSVSVVSSDAGLRNLTVGGVQVPGFSGTQYTYEVAVPGGTGTAPVLEAVPISLNAAVEITQARMVNGRGTARAVVRAQNGISTKTYVVNFHEASSDANLASLTVPGYTMNQAFSADVTAYSVLHSAINTTAPVVNAAATSGKASVAITQAGANSTGTATVVVTAEDGTTVKTYTVKFNQYARGLTNLTVNGSYSLSPGFSSDTTAYTLINSTNSFRIRSYVTYGTIKVNGTVISSGTQSTSFPRGTRVTIEVEETGRLTKTYTIN